MENEGRFRQEPGFSSGQRFDAGAPRPRRVENFTLGPNSRLIIEGKSRLRSEPVKGTGRAGRHTGQRR